MRFMSFTKAWGPIRWDRSPVAAAVIVVGRGSNVALP